MRFFLVSLFFLTCSALPGPWNAASAETCTVTASNVSFGNYDALSGAPLDSTGTVSVTCTSSIPPTVTYDVHLDRGLWGTFAPRRMDNLGSRLNYNLYTDATYATVWGDGTGTTSVISDNYGLGPPGSTRTINYTIYGRIPASQMVGLGLYTDTITVTVCF